MKAFERKNTEDDNALELQNKKIIGSRKAGTVEKGRKEVTVLSDSIVCHRSGCIYACMMIGVVRNRLCFHACLYKLSRLLFGSVGPAGLPCHCIQLLASGAASTNLLDHIPWCNYLQPPDSKVQTSLNALLLSSPLFIIIPLRSCADCAASECEAQLFIIC